MNPIDSNNRFGSAAINLAALQNRNSVADRIQAARARIQSNIFGQMNLPQDTQGPVQQPQPQDIPETPLENIFSPPEPAPTAPSNPVAPPTPPAQPPVATPAPEPAAPTPPPAPVAPTPAPAAPAGPTELGPISEVTSSFSGSVQPGSLLIADEFTPSPGGLTHGEVVTASALETGFQGPVERMNVQALPQVQEDRAAQETGAVALAEPNLSQQQTLAIVADVTEASVGAVLKSGIRALDSAIEGGATNSALNLSLSASPADLTSFYVTNIVAGASAEPGSDARSASENFTRAFGVDLDQLTDTDPAVSNQARTMLAERTGQFVEQVFANSPEIQADKQSFDQKLVQFESGNNSVVVIAGNSGSFVDQLEADKGGPLNLSSTFEQSLLAHPDATLVGATIDVNGSERVANYSSDSPGIDLFASGTHDPNPRVSGDEQFGTSFAAPDVAATMARLHLENPDLSSAQIQNLLLREETHRIAGDNGFVSSLDGGPINEPQAQAPASPPQDRFSLFFNRGPREDIRARFLDIFGT